MDELTLAPGGAVVVATDVAADGDKKFRREYRLCRAGGSDYSAVTASDLSSVPAAEKVVVVIYPTKTYSEGLGGDKPSPIAPEDRAMLRALAERCAGGLECWQVGSGGAGESGPAPAAKSFEVHPEYLRRMGELFKSSMTTPNRQDYMWLLTKTFGLNLAIRLIFMVKAVRAGELPLLRAVCSTSWYQVQDAVFTVFGQTYMKFLGKMTGLVRIFGAQVGDFVFVYIQLCGFEFLNRLVLGPLGENPLVYTPKGLLLIFANILQGMLSGGPLIPAINKMRRAGVISHSTMMHLYQASSLTMQFGLFASFGYQKFYAILTGSVLVFAWGSYIVFSKFYQDPPMGKVADPGLVSRLGLLH